MQAQARSKPEYKRSTPATIPDTHAGTDGMVCSHLHTDHDAVHEHVSVPEMLWLMLAAAL